MNLSAITTKIEVACSGMTCGWLNVRPAEEIDVPSVTSLIHQAFEVWKKRGLKLSPMYQTDEQTAGHLLNKGIVALDSSNTIVGTFSLDDGQVSTNAKGRVEFSEGIDPAVEFLPEVADSKIVQGKYLVFKKAAVHSEYGHKGIGRKLYDLAEVHARENGYVGVVIETVREAEWLFDWYVSLGFKAIAHYRYPKSHVDTVLMVKPFGDAVNSL